MIFYKKINTKDSIIIILCDENLYGKEFKENNKILKINEFYLGEKVKDIEDNILENATVINAIGEESISLLIKKKIILEEDKKYIKYISNIPYIFIIRE